MLRENASRDQWDEIEEALTAPPDFRDPVTGLPPGWTSDADEWESFDASFGQ